MTKFNQDDIVKSKSFGIGKVIAIDYKTEMCPVKVKFDGLKEIKAFTLTGRYYVGMESYRDIKKLGFIGKIIYNLLDRR